MDSAEIQQAEIQNDVKIAPEERGSSGLGTLIGLGTALAAGVSVAGVLAALHVALPLILAGGAALAVMTGGMMVLQNAKEKKNVEHARESYSLKKGYHKEPEVVKDDSLMHLIKGRDDLPERVKYIKDNYGMEPVSANAWRGKYLATGVALGLGAAVVVGGGLLLALGTAGMALPFALTMGALAGGMALAGHSAHTMTRYDKYIDDMARQGAANEAQQAKRGAQKQKQPEVEYDNGSGRTRTFCEDVTASRQQAATKVIDR